MREASLATNKRLLKDTSPATFKRAFNDTSLATNRRLFKDKSPATFKRAFNDTSLATNRRLFKDASVPTYNELVVANEVKHVVVDTLIFDEGPISDKICPSPDIFMSVSLEEYVVLVQLAP